MAGVTQPGPRVLPGNCQSGKECCGLPMQTLDVFGIRLFRCMHRGHHPLVFRNLSTGEEVTEEDEPGDGGLEWASHYREDST